MNNTYLFLFQKLASLIVMDSHFYVDWASLTNGSCASFLKRDGPPHDSSVQKGNVPHGFHKLTVAFFSISPSQYGYFDAGTLF